MGDTVHSYLLHLTLVQQESPVVQRLYKAVQIASPQKVASRGLAPSSHITNIFIQAKTFGLKFNVPVPRIVQGIMGGFESSTPDLNAHILPLGHSFLHSYLKGIGFIILEKHYLNRLKEPFQ